ncbi:hypothetical protein [Klebsiella grimontii]|uniref:hypothetical protein n=1 Tax=Klebsiella grimontii TaxID=2058152 RepID=UPI0029347D4B|nr:hypothetical protein [Klebsiella grimontii]
MAILNIRENSLGVHVKNYQEQIDSVAGWAASGKKWCRIPNKDGSYNPGSCGENVVKGFLPRDRDSGELIVIYQCHLPFPENHAVRNFQFSQLKFSDWEKYMTPIE